MIDFAKLDLMDALDLAILVEEEARERYEEFAQLVGGRYPGDADEVFRSMAASETKHAERLARRRHKRFGDAPRRVSRDLLDDAEAPDRGKPRVFMSPRQAMAVAIESEEKAQAFYAQAARLARDPAARKLFEELRVEEAGHRKLLQSRIRKYPEGPDVEESEADAPGSDPG